ncbi:MAG TPA: pentapeptide repeat-containing protein [Sedimenticola thiotaurini]|uniref:Pentapeptide repeat-containing protein n=1 Tax=Sedimenticola thiotaurini TaxID=1543721 RepID=A0A831W5X1_9GAMM|nr:pentapeptide repeat-containing protein [Sedimenticola thiotaurini]
MTKKPTTTDFDVPRPGPTILDHLPQRALLRELKGMDLSNQDLRGQDLHHADLTGCDLAGADLRAVKLRGSNLADVYLASTDLRGADLRQVTMSFQCDDTDFGGADLRDGFIGVMDATDDSDPPSFTNADLRGCRLRGHLRGARFNGADLRGADFNGDATGATFSGAKLDASAWKSAERCKGDLTGAIPVGFDPTA